MKGSATTQSAPSGSRERDLSALVLRAEEGVLRAQLLRIRPATYADVSERDTYVGDGGMDERKEEGSPPRGNTNTPLQHNSSSGGGGGEPDSFVHQAGRSCQAGRGVSRKSIRASAVLLSRQPPSSPSSLLSFSGYASDTNQALTLSQRLRQRLQQQSQGQFGISTVSSPSSIRQGPPLSNVMRMMDNVNNNRSSAARFRTIEGKEDDWARQTQIGDASIKRINLVATSYNNKRGRNSGYDYDDTLEDDGVHRLSLYPHFLHKFGLYAIKRLLYYSNLRDFLRRCWLKAEYQMRKSALRRLIKGVSSRSQAKLRDLKMLAGLFRATNTASTFSCAREVGNTTMWSNNSRNRNNRFNESVSKIDGLESVEKKALRRAVDRFRKLVDTRIQSVRRDVRGKLIRECLVKKRLLGRLFNRLVVKRRCADGQTFFYARLKHLLFRNMRMSVKQAIDMSIASAHLRRKKGICAVVRLMYWINLWYTRTEREAIADRQRQVSIRRRGLRYLRCVLMKEKLEKISNAMKATRYARMTLFWTFRKCALVFILRRRFSSRASRYLDKKRLHSNALRFLRLLSRLSNYKSKYSISNRSNSSRNGTLKKLESGIAVFNNKKKRAFLQALKWMRQYKKKLFKWHLKTFHSKQHMPYYNGKSALRLWHRRVLERARQAEKVASVAIVSTKVLLVYCFHRMRSIVLKRKRKGLTYVSINKNAAIRTANAAKDKEEEEEAAKKATALVKAAKEKEDTKKKVEAGKVAKERELELDSETIAARVNQAKIKRCFKKLRLNCSTHTRGNRHKCPPFNYHRYITAYDEIVTASNSKIFAATFQALSKNTRICLLRKKALRRNTKILNRLRKGNAFKRLQEYLEDYFVASLLNNMRVADRYNRRLMLSRSAGTWRQYASNRKDIRIAFKSTRRLGCLLLCLFRTWRRFASSRLDEADRLDSLKHYFYTSSSRGEVGNVGFEDRPDVDDFSQHTASLVEEALVFPPPGVGVSREVYFRLGCGCRRFLSRLRACAKSKKRLNGQVTKYLNTAAKRRMKQFCIGRLFQQAQRIALGRNKQHLAYKHHVTRCISQAFRCFRKTTEQHRASMRKATMDRVYEARLRTYGRKALIRWALRCGRDTYARSIRADKYADNYADNYAGIC
jgi:hypothetical protein